MEITKLIAALALPLCIGTGALASEVGDPIPAAFTSTVSRAEVLAELQIWRESGLAALEDGEGSAAYTPRHDAALAKYQAMRAAPTFAALVQRIAQQRGETLVIASAQ